MAKTATPQFFTYYGKEALQGGLNVTDNPLIIGPAEMTQASNIAIAQSLARRKRPGQQSYALGSYTSTVGEWPTVGKPIRGITQYWRFASATGESQQDLFLHSDNKVWSIPDRTNPAVNRSNGFTFDTAGIPSYQVFQGILYFLSSQNSDGYKKWNGRATVPGNVQVAVPPPDGAGKILGIFRGRMMMAGNSSFPFRLYLSSALDAENWTGVDATSFDFDYDGEPSGITAIFPELNGTLYVATRRSIYALTCTDPANVATFQIQRVTRGIGCIGPTMFAPTPNDILFWSDRGLHSIRKVIVSDQAEVTFLSAPIQKLYTEMINTSIITQGAVIWDERQNLLLTSLPSSGQLKNDTVLVYNLNYAVWTTYTGVNARSLANVLVNNQEFALSGREDGSVTYLDPTLKTDLGLGFSSTFTTGKIFPGGDLTTQKMFKSVTILGSATSVSSIQLSWTVDGIDSSYTDSRAFPLAQGNFLLGQTFVLGAATLGIGRFLPHRTTIDQVGYNIQLTLSASGNSDFEFYGFILEVDDADPNYS